MRPAARGTLRDESLRFGSLQATSVKTRLRLYPGQVFFDDLKFDFYGGHADGDLSFDSGERIPRYAAKARLSGVDLARLLEAFPEARGKLTGKMEGDLKVSGDLSHSPDPLAGMRGAGQVNIRNGEMPSLQLNKNLMALARVDRKSTRLNSSHVRISYAVFCLKKKKQQNNNHERDTHVEIAAHRDVAQ